MRVLKLSESCRGFKIVCRGTGAVSVVINSIPYDFRGKHTIGASKSVITAASADRGAQERYSLSSISSSSSST